MPQHENTMPHSTAYFDQVTRRNWRTWLWSGLTALGLNALLFLAMPQLLDPAPAQPAVAQLIPQVNVIRMARPETPVKRQTVQPPPEKPKPLKKPRTAPRQPAMARLTLPFEINPRLPSAPNMLTLPALESAPPAPAATLPGAFDAGQLDGPLTVLVRIPPVYPLRARRRGIEGWVKVLLIVEADGRVTDIDIAAAEPPGVFEQSVRRCVAGWRFRPGTVEGMPVRARVETTIRFTLE